MKYGRDLCESAKRGHLCIDDLCHGTNVTLCGFDPDDYRDISEEYEPLYSDEAEPIEEEQ